MKEISEEELTKAELKEEILFRFRILQNKYRDIPSFNDTKTLSELRLAYEIEVEAIKRKEETKEIEVLRGLLNIEPGDKEYTLKELNNMLDIQLRELNITRKDFLNLINVYRMLSVVTELSNRVL